ncbi:MAG: DUF3667 domain-containing protein [Psychroflexus sp.]
MKQPKPWDGNEKIEVVQKKVVKRFTFRTLLNDVLLFINFEKGLPFTIKSLVLSPGESIRSYLGEGRYRFTNPIKYYILTVTIYLFLAFKIFDKQISESYFINAEDSNAFLNIVLEYLNVWIFSITFYVSIFSYLIFRKSSGFNFVENLILNIYITSQILLVEILLFPLKIMENIYLSIGLSIIYLSYIIFVYKRFFNLSLGKTILKLGITGVLAFLSMLFVLIFSGLVYGFVNAAFE